MTSPLTPPMTRTLTLSLKNTIPTLALLVAIFMLSGCVGKAIDSALNRLEQDGKDLVKDINTNIGNINGIDDLKVDDPCKTTSVLFGDLKLCPPASYNLVRENQCTNDFDATLCATTVTRVCDNNINRPLCIGKPAYEPRRLAGLRLVDDNDWTASFTDATGSVILPLATTPDSAIERNQFLSGLTDAKAKNFRLSSVLDAEIRGNESPTQKRAQQAEFTIQSKEPEGWRVYTLTLTHAQPEVKGGNGIVIRQGFYGFKQAGATAADGASTGDSNDAVSFVSGQFKTRFGECINRACDVQRYYAGIHASTDLGAPITNVNQVSGWKGFLRTVSNDGVQHSVPFDINITYDGSNLSGTIKADFTDGANVDIDATFNSFGAITGDIILGGSALRSPGTISGIIGQGGLVAAFISDETGVSSAQTPAGYAGGFVAYLPNPTPPDNCVTEQECVDYTHWVTAANPATTLMANRFLTGTPTGLTTGRSFPGTPTTIGSSNVVNGLRAGEVTDGFAIYFSGGTHNAGLLSTTRLGDPWRNSLTGQWKGQFASRVEDENSIRLSNFTLTVNFSGSSGTVSATNVGNSGAYSFTANYNTYGVIENGTITRTDGQDISTGTVTGLIGTDSGFGGAVGVFHSNTGATTSYVGGFVASGNNEKPTPGS